MIRTINLIAFFTLSALGAGVVGLVAEPEMVHHHQFLAGMGVGALFQGVCIAIGTKYVSKLDRKIERMGTVTVTKQSVVERPTGPRIVEQEARGRVFSAAG